MGKLTHLESAFATTEDSVVAHLNSQEPSPQVSKLSATKSVISGVESVAKRIVAGVKTRESDKARVLAVTVLRHVDSRRWIVKLHVLKGLGRGNRLQVNDTRTLKQLSQIEVKHPQDGTSSSDVRVLTFLYEGGKTFNWAVTTPWLRRCTLNMVCQVGEDMSRFIGCLATLSTEMLRSTVKVLGVNNSVVEQWSVDYKSETLSDDAKQDKKERDDKDALTSASQLTKEEERGLQSYLDAYQIHIGDVSTFEPRLRQEISNLEAANVHALVKRGKQAVKIDGALKVCENQLDDLEEWLMVFSSKLSNMRHDIHAIEERNNDLETSSWNNEILIKILKDFTAMIAFPVGLEQRIRNCSFDSEDNIKDALSSLRSLHEYKARLRGDELKTLVGMRAVRDQLEYCSELQVELFRKFCSQIKSRLEDSVEELIESGIVLDAEIMPEAAKWDHIHSQLAGFSDFVQSLHLQDSSSSCINKLLLYQLRGTVSRMRLRCTTHRAPEKLSSNEENIMPDKIYKVVLQNFLKLLLEETIFVANFFSQSTWSDDQRLENSSVVASSQRTNFIFDEEMKVLFLSFQNEIFKLIDWVASVDSMLCIPMLGATGRALNSSDVFGTPLFEMLTVCQERIQRLLFKYLDENYLVNDGRSSAELSGRSMAEIFGFIKPENLIVKEISFLPFLFSKLESLSDVHADDSPHLEEVYTRILAATDRSIENACQADTKRAERIRLVNYCVLEESLKQLSSCDGSRALAEYVQVAGEKCEDSCNVYVSKIAEKEFGGLLEVACHLKLTIDHGVQAAELPYHPGCEEEAVRKGLLSVNTRSFQALHKRMRKHLGALPQALINQVWKKCFEWVLGWLTFLQSVYQSVTPLKTVADLRRYCLTLD